jgi:hypothetical protein
MGNRFATGELGHPAAVAHVPERARHPYNVASRQTSENRRISQGRKAVPPSALEWMWSIIACETRLGAKSWFS